jgi:hypothetical protein
MSVNPGLPEIPKIKNPKTYPNELWEESPTDGVPSFFEFLEKHRGIKRELFQNSQFDPLLQAALNTELLFYNAFCQKIQMDKDTKNRDKMKGEVLSHASLEELQVLHTQLSSDLDRINEEIRKVANELSR